MDCEPRLVDRKGKGMEGSLMPYESAIKKSAEYFADAAGGLEYDREKIFAMQQLLKSSNGRQYALEIANANPLSVRLAMANLAATGLTLNPAHGYAYLVPRDGAIVLEISYRGLLKIATDTGSILWGRAEVVRDADTFVYRGPAAMPEHGANAFRERGEVIGAYCIARTRGGDILCEIMDRAEVEKIRAKSDLYAKKKSGPWVEWFDEMARKAVIKRAQKTWPHTDQTGRLLDAIELANASEGGYLLDAVPVETVTDAQAATIRDLIEANGIDAASFLSLYGVASVEALPRLRYAEAVSTLNRRALGP